MLSLYNSLKNKKEIFDFARRKIKIYTCGPTVYDFAHIGNFRAYIFADILVRYLKFLDYKRFWVMNITDIDDKTILGAKKAHLPLVKFTEKYEKAFFEDLKSLNIERADKYPRAIENIKEIQNLIVVLWEKGLAYEKNGSVYYDISKFEKYGQLSKIVLDEKSKKSRIDNDSYEKRSPADFALWKKSRKGEPHWKLKIENCELIGRPGWHIECSAMAMKYLGKTIDFHLGGVDLKFPHHENEIAQSEGATGKTFSRFWLHNEHLLVEGKKMSKSLGNFYTLRDLIKKGFDPLAFRYLCLQTHWQSKMDFSFRALRAAENALKEIRKLRFRNYDLRIKREKIIKEINVALSDNLDTPQALAILHKQNDFRLWQYFEPVLSLGIKNYELRIKNNIKELIKQREKLRKMGKFEKADVIRKEIKRLGYEIEDTEKGPQIIDIH